MHKELTKNFTISVTIATQLKRNQEKISVMPGWSFRSSRRRSLSEYPEDAFWEALNTTQIFLDPARKIPWNIRTKVINRLRGSYLHMPQVGVLLHKRRIVLHFSDRRRHRTSIFRKSVMGSRLAKGKRTTNRPSDLREYVESKYWSQYSSSGESFCCEGTSSISQNFVRLSEGFETVWYAATFDEATGKFRDSITPVIIYPKTVFCAIGASVGSR